MIPYPTLKATYRRRGATDRRRLAVAVVGLLLLCLGLWECGLGWAQLSGFCRSRHPLFPVTGSFYNPGPYCGFLAVLIPFSLHKLINDHEPINDKVDNLIQKGVNILSSAYLVPAVALMPVLMGRTGWIAAFAGSLLSLWLTVG